jgi:hypothetical protein
MKIEYTRKKLELARVTLAKEEMELRIQERLDEISRLEENIKIQEKTEEKLKTELAQMSGG